MTNRWFLVIVIAALGVTIGVLVYRSGSGGPRSPTGWTPIDHVADGDTVVLKGHVTVRLVQIDTPEVYFKPECFGEAASAETKRLLPPGTLVRLVPDPATDKVDHYGRLLRYVIRRDGLNVNLQLVADGAAAPYFFEDVRGMYADELMRETAEARTAGKGFWGACPGTELAPDAGVSTGPPNA